MTPEEVQALLQKYLDDDGLTVTQLVEQYEELVAASGPSFIGSLLEKLVAETGDKAKKLVKRYPVLEAGMEAYVESTRRTTVQTGRPRGSGPSSAFVPADPMIPDLI